MSLATPEAFDNNPSRVWQFYHMRREKLATSRHTTMGVLIRPLLERERLNQTRPIW